MIRKTLLAALLAAAALPVAAGSGDADVGKKKSAPCAACHGEKGVSVGPEFPNLAGQYEDYLVTVLHHYKNGKRKNPIMTPQAASLKDKDIDDLAAYFASQTTLEVKH